MDDEQKKTFGAYILQRRKELGMTQKEFAGKLYVTESAVSKWERGLSYPDIGLLRSICGVLQISEHELLTGSEDTSKRNSERLAAKYLRLTRGYRVVQYLLYGGALAGCAIGNLASSHTLDWFFIVLASLMMAASLTLAPALAALHPVLRHCRAAVALGGFTVSLELLLLTCCLYSGGSWFPVAGISVLFGLSLVLLPFLLPTLPLPACMAGRKTSVYLITETVLLLLLLLISCLYTGGGWFLMAAVSVVFGLGFWIVPVLLWQLPLPDALKSHKLLLYFSIQTLLLAAVLAVAELYTGAGTFLQVSLPSAAVGLALPWGIMLAGRYLPVNGWLRGAVCALWTGCWFWLFPFALDWILSLTYGPVYNSLPLWYWTEVDFGSWAGGQGVINVLSLILASSAGAALLLAGVGIWRRGGKRRQP